MVKLVVLLFLFVVFPPINMTDFKSEQLKNSRVKTAFNEKSTLVTGLLKSKFISNPYIFIRAFKKEQILEVWAREKTREKYVLIKQYDFCSSSGSLGPKRRQGDLQIPEGVYYIDRFNPWSTYYLSLGLNYPNTSDRILGYKKSLGGDIFIHGDCVTIGCVPLTDDKIKEIYVFAVEAKNNGQNKIPVYIFPTKLTESNYQNLIKANQKNGKLISFWSNLMVVYESFEKSKKLAKVSVNSEGGYILN